MGWIDRMIRGPDEDYFDADALRKLVRLPEEVFDRLVKEGIVPPPIRLTTRTVNYSWRHAVFLSLWLELNAGTPPPGGKTSGGN